MGRCAALPTNGQPCAYSYDRDCAQGTYCDTSRQPQLCRTEGTCTADFMCSRGRVCNLTTRTCRASAPQGQACSTSRVCPTGQVCIGGVCDAPLGIGEQCRSTSECVDGAWCDTVLRICLNPIQVSSGAACTNAAFYCGSGERCFGASSNPDGGVGTTGTCRAPRIGDVCSIGQRCPS